MLTAGISEAPGAVHHAPSAEGAGPDRAPLDRYANNLSAGEGNRADSQASRRLRYGLRSEVMWSQSTIERCRKCGRVPVAEGVDVRASWDGRASFAGLATCASVWACPVCSPRILARRHVELASAMILHMQRGGRLLFATYTVSHKSKHTLPWVWDGVRDAWQRVISGRASQLERATWGIEGFVRLAEVTYGRNGWHVHHHVLWFVEPGRELIVDWAPFLDSTRKRWTKAAREHGMRAPRKELFDMQEVHGPDADAVARYFADVAKKVALEFTNAASKTKAYATYSPWAILAGLASGQTERFEDVWATWEQGSRGRKAMTWSVGLREKLALGRERLDAELAGPSDEDFGIVRILNESWRMIARQRLACDVLEALENGGWPGLRDFLEDRGIGYEVIG